MRHAALLLAAGLALAGCSDDDPAERGGPGPGGRSAEERAIRGWVDALNAGDYRRAASYFARGAVVEQARESRLPDRAAAEAFNRSLPCKAELTDLDNRGRSVVAAFRLRRGRGPADTCGGAARVRFRFKGGRFSEWRQLPEPRRQPGDVV